MSIWGKLISMLLRKYADLLLQYFFISGTILATMLSWDTYHSYIWVVFHGLLGWIYICYSEQYWILLSFFLSMLSWYVVRAVKSMMEISNVVNKIKESIEK
jgi:hypothetical protein